MIRSSACLRQADPLPALFGWHGERRSYTTSWDTIQGWLPGRDVTVFSDGEIGLQSIVVSATRQPITHILDWFHLSMRLRHVEQTWEGIRHVHDLNIYLRDVGVHVPRLRHLLWSGYLGEATKAVKQMLYQLHQHAGRQDANNKLKRLYELVRNLGTYLVQNKASIVNYCQRYWSGQPISSSPTESAANSLVNERMNKKRQMRWSPIVAHRVLQVRAAVADGRLKRAKLALAA